MRIIGGRIRGRKLVALDGGNTRPTADRTRQALFDMLLHAPWFGRRALEEAVVLDGFAGTGAVGLEALSRGAAGATFLERDRTAFSTLRQNVAACGAQKQSRLFLCDTTRPPPAERRHTLVFLDPPYGQGLVEKALDALTRADWLAEGALIVAETGAEEGFTPPSDAAIPSVCLAARRFGAGFLTIWRLIPS